MSFEELIVAARVEDLRRDIARWERGQSAIAELRDAHHEPKPRFGFRRRSPRRAWCSTAKRASDRPLKSARMAHRRRRDGERRRWEAGGITAVMML